MTLQEALQVAKHNNALIHRSGCSPQSLDWYLSQGGFQVDDVTSNDWEVSMPSKSFTALDVASAWDKMAVLFKSVKSSEHSPVFQALIKEMYHASSQEE